MYFFLFGCAGLCRWVGFASVEDAGALSPAAGRRLLPALASPARSVCLRARGLQQLQRLASVGVAPRLWRTGSGVPCMGLAGTWGLPGSETELGSFSFACGFFTTEPPRKAKSLFFFNF